MIFLGVFYFIPAGLLNVPVVQEKISAIASEKLRETLGVDVQIKRVDLELFNQLIIKDIYLEDQAGDTLFQAKRLSARFDLIPLFKGKFQFGSAQLFGFQVNLSKETPQSPLNLQFVLDAFASKDTTKKESAIDLRIRNLSLKKGSFSYHIQDAYKTPGKFNAKHIEVNDLSAKIHLNTFTKDSLEANIDYLSFTERSGLDVQCQLLGLKADNKKAGISQLEVQTGNSRLLLENISADYSSRLTNKHNYIEECIVDLTIQPSQIYLLNLSAFVPAFSGFKEPINIQGRLTGSLNDLSLQDFRLTDRNNLLLEANAKLQDITYSEKFHVNGTVHHSFITTEEIKKLNRYFNAGQEDIPATIYQLGNIQFEGEVSGYIHDLTAYGIFDTDIGSLRTDINIGKNENRFLKGTISSNGIDLRKLSGDNPDFGNASFGIEINVQQDPNQKYTGEIEAQLGRFEFKNYSYENIRLSGDFTEESFNGQININSPEGEITSEGFFKWNGESSEFIFSAQANNIKLDKLNLSKKYKDSELSFHLDVNFAGNSIDNIAGHVYLTDMKFDSEKGHYYLDTLAVNAGQENDEKIINIQSDLLHGEIRGSYSFARLFPSIKQTLSNYLPALLKADHKEAPDSAHNDVSFNLTIDDLEELSHMLDLPFTLHNKSKIVGQYNSVYEKFKIEAYFPKFSFKNSRFESGRLILENPEKDIKLTVDAVSIQKNDKRYPFSSRINASNDSIHTLIKWADNVGKNNQGGLVLATKFSRESDYSPLKSRIDIQESHVIFNDSVWTFHPATIIHDSGKVEIYDLVIDHKDQHIKADGIISRSKDDILWVELNKVNLNYIFNTLAIKALTFGGTASGSVEVSDLYETRQLSTNLNVKDFSFNDVVFGDLNLMGAWDDKEQGVLMTGSIVKNDSSGVDVNGLLYPTKNELSVNFDARNADAAFLRKYLDKVASGISGEITGNLHLFGNFSDVTVEGNVFVKNGNFGIDYLNTRYSFTDSVRLKPDEITLDQVTLYDKFGRPALVNGSVKHRFFEDFTFYATLQVSNFLVFDATEKQNPLFHGTAFGTGSATLRGNEQSVNIDVSMRSDRDTRIGLNFMEESDIAEYDFINFVSKKEQETVQTKPITSFTDNRPILFKTDTGTEIQFNLLLEATPDATIEMIIDPISGDKIKGYGKGNLQIQYGTRSPLKIFGKYEIENGNYNFSLQQVIYRDFSIREGSSISFKGDPYDATMDVVAIYSVPAYLGDLDDQLITETPRTNVMVNCVLGISGEIMHPNVTFDLELPGSNEALERQVKSIINTDDMMNRQIVYLLVLNKFYTIQDNLTPGNNRSNDLSSLASATLSSQLSGILSAMSDNIQIGTRIKTTDGDFTDTEVALLLSSQLMDNRLIFNGNFGYRDNPNMEGRSNFIGDFDLEYKLSRTGDIRLKAYNHYSENYYNLKTRTTQGLGIMFKRDFDRFGDLLLGRKKLPAPVILPEDNDTLPVSFLHKKNDFIFFKE